MDATVLEADDEAAEVLSQRHAIGMLPNQDKVRLEGPARDKRDDVLFSNAQQHFQPPLVPFPSFPFFSLTHVALFWAVRHGLLAFGLNKPNKKI